MGNSSFSKRLKFYANLINVNTMLKSILTYSKENIYEKINSYCMR